MKLNSVRTVKLLKAYRKAGLGLGGAYKRLGSFKAKHNFY